MRAAVITVLLAALCTTAAAASRTFTGVLTGRDEVPPVASRAQGEATFQLNTEGTALSFRVTVANIEFVQSAHIHLGAVGVNGPVVVALFNGPTIQGPQNGVLASGTITAATLTGPLAGRTLRALLDAMDAGNAYVNVHTNRYPAGEIRGQIR